MTTIRIDTAQVESTGGQFATKRGELESLTSQARSMMNALQGQFTGVRANRIFAEWEGMQPNLQAAIETLQAASDLLKRASADFSMVDQGL